MNAIRLEVGKILRQSAKERFNIINFPVPLSAKLSIHFLAFWKTVKSRTKEEEEENDLFLNEFLTVQVLGKAFLIILHAPFI